MKQPLVRVGGGGINQTLKVPTAALGPRLLSIAWMLLLIVSSIDSLPGLSWSLRMSYIRSISGTSMTRHVVEGMKERQFGDC